MRVVNLDIPYFNLILLLAFLLEHNVDEKNMRNIELKESMEISHPSQKTHSKTYTL